MASSGNNSDKATSSTGKSGYQIVKEGWGSRTNFQMCHGLKMDPDGLEEGRAILKGYQELDRQEQAQGQSKSSTSKK